tara:strand:- start:384 stop:497 length:114 start_codon:yes stop_codon:yes gene_type:complete
MMVELEQQQVVVQVYTQVLQQLQDNNLVVQVVVVQVG